MSSQSRKPLVISLWAGPGVGKTTTAALTFASLKLARVSCELVTEYAKELHYEGRLRETPQREILAEQIRRLSRVQGHADVIVTDAPLHVSQVYAHPHEHDEIAQMLARDVPRFEFWNVLLHRDLGEFYEGKGRWQSSSESEQFHHEKIVPFVRGMVAERFFEMHVDGAPVTLRDAVLEHLAKTPDA